MTVTPMPSEGFPSRRSLRERAKAAPQQPINQQEHEGETQPAVETEAQSTTETDAQKRVRESHDTSPMNRVQSDPLFLQLPAPEASSLGFARLPLREHVPAVSVDTRSETKTPRSMLQRLARFGAAASVCGLVLAFALPLASQAAGGTEETAAAASQQRLFSEVSPDEIPDYLASIEAVVADDSAPQLFTFRPFALMNYPFSSPVLLTDPFGYRAAPVAGFHDAQDYGAAPGTPIQVIADGVVTEAGFASDGCGFGLKVQHDIEGQDVTSRYCHMQNDSHNYRVGDVVKMGDRAGGVGETGLAFGAHLHMAVRVNDEPVDPMPFIAKYHKVNRPS